MIVAPPVFDGMRVLLVDVFTPVECVPFGVGSRHSHWLSGYWWGGGAWCGHAVTPACSLTCSIVCGIYHRTLAGETNGCCGWDTETPTRTCPTPYRGALTAVDSPRARTERALAELVTGAPGRITRI